MGIGYSGKAYRAYRVICSKTFHVVVYRFVRKTRNICTWLSLCFYFFNRLEDCLKLSITWMWWQPQRCGGTLSSPGRGQGPPLPLLVGYTGIIWPLITNWFYIILTHVKTDARNVYVILTDLSITSFKYHTVLQYLSLSLLKGTKGNFPGGDMCYACTIFKFKKF